MFKALTIIQYDGEPLEVEDTNPLTETELIDYIQDILRQGGLVNVDFRVRWIGPVN